MIALGKVRKDPRFIPSTVGITVSAYTLVYFVNVVLERAFGGAVFLLGSLQETGTVLPGAGVALLELGNGGEVGVESAVHADDLAGTDTAAADAGLADPAGGTGNDSLFSF